MNASVDTKLMEQLQSFQEKIPPLTDIVTKLVESEEKKDEVHEEISVNMTAVIKRVSNK